MFKGVFTAAILTAASFLCSCSNAGPIFVEKSISGEYKGVGTDINQTSDGGYLLAGTHYSSSKSSSLWLIKTDGLGDIEWEKKFKKLDETEGLCAQETVDGGYILLAQTSARSDRDEPLAWLIKTDREGMKNWERTFEGYKENPGSLVQPTSDGGYLLAGTVRSFREGTPVSTPRMIKIKEDGSIEWDRLFEGGNHKDKEVSYVQQTMDGGYIMLGNLAADRSRPLLLIKTSSNGQVEWENSLRTLDRDEGQRIKQTVDGGYAIIGSRTGLRWGEQGADESNKVLLLKTDSRGELVWRRTFHRGSSAFGYDLEQTSDCGFILVGRAERYSPLFQRIMFFLYSRHEQDGKINPMLRELLYSLADRDTWLIKTDDAGNTEWDHIFSGERFSEPKSICLAPDGGYAVTGETYKPEESVKLYFLKVFPPK